MSTAVKICGLTDLSDTLDAIELGADYLGFNFYPDSKRYVDPEQCKKIIDEIPFSVGKIGVFVNCDAQLVSDIAIELNLDMLQFHGDESPEYCRHFGRPFMKAIRPKSVADLNNLADYQAEFILIDSWVENAYGGTGIISNWDLAREAKKQHKIFLSGGLTPQNVETAILAVKPFAVDVASGVECDNPRRKDYHRMQEFITRAKGVNQ